jgi:hypothetical protein
MGPSLLHSTTGSALISKDGVYRDLLLRHLPGDGDTVVFCMLNPSTADHTADDPTIRRCIGFAMREGARSLAVINLYALRATNPNDLWKHPDPVGPYNDSVIADVACKYRRVVCAWGSNAKPSRVRTAMRMFERYRTETLCLGTNVGGSPKHPLYIKSDQPFLPYYGG